jgi:hypothetical protein
MLLMMFSKKVHHRKHPESIRRKLLKSLVSTTNSSFKLLQSPYISTRCIQLSFHPLVCPQITVLRNTHEPFDFDSAMTEPKVILTYASSPNYLASDNWKQTYAALLAQLPLRNIHWKSSTRPVLRTIQELDIALVPLEGFRDDHTSQIPSTLLEKPFLNIYVTACEVCLRSPRNTLTSFNNLLRTRRCTNLLSESRSRTGILSFLKGRIKNG